MGSKLAARGLRTRWLLGDCANMAGCVSYARPIWESPAARPYLGVFAFHTWDSSAPFPTWTNALRLATVYVRALKLTGATSPSTS